MATELTERMRFQPGEKIDRGQVRGRGEPFLNHGNVRIEHRWPTRHRFAPQIAAPMNFPLLTLFPTIIGGKHVGQVREDRTEAGQINKTWAMDFVHDQLATDRKIRVLTIVDTFSRFSPAVDPRSAIEGGYRADFGTRLQGRRLSQDDPRRPGVGVRLRDLDIWAYQKNVVLDFSRPGMTTDNSFIESFNGSFRSECLNTHWLLRLDDAPQKNGGLA
ncbi:transposase InsO family protein [Bradyrhizobium sp. USDA 3397]